MKKGKRKSNLRVGATMEKVLRRYGQDVGHEKPSENFNVEVGRKQRRREAKLQRKRKRMQCKSVNGSDITQEKVIAEKVFTVNSKEKKDKIWSETLKKTVYGVRKEELKKANKKEDNVISALEKKLFLNKKGNKKLPKSFVDAGLDYILDVVNGGAGSDLSDEEPLNSGEDEFLSNVANGEDEIMGDEEEEVEDSLGQEDSAVWDDEDPTTEEEEEKEDGHRGSGCGSEPSNILSSSGEKYIPPAMRVKLSDEQEEKIKKLKRRLKGLLNRLSDANISKICSDVEGMYQESSRAIMHKVLTETVLDQFCTCDPIPEALLLENAMLMAALSLRMGLESLLHFYEAVTLRLYSLTTKKAEADGKIANNLLLLLCYLYQFKAIDCKVILDIFRILIESFTEKDIELILEILNKIGFQLRKDDPESLRNIIQSISSKCEEVKADLDDGSRMSYMMNILMAVKNNNIRKITGYDPEKVNNRRKNLSQLAKNSEGNTSGNAVPPITLQDFQQIETNGRWWIVGSSFAGRPMLRSRNEWGNDSSDENLDIEKSVSRKVADAARMQRMNTDVRRKIFYAVMTADDFVDAFEKVLKCSLKGKQLREIATVVVDCCQQEKSFNPYYLHLLNRFCQHDRQFAISVQCTMWDRFKVLGSMKENQMVNIAQLLSHLIIMEDLSLNCLKAIDFTEIDKTMIKFVRLFLRILAQESSGIDHLRTIFGPLRVSSKSKVVRQGLHLFLQYFVLSDDKFMSEHFELQDHFQAMLAAVAKSKSALL